MNFSKSMIIAKWEFVEKVKRKSFLISMIITPVFLIGMAIIPTLLANTDENTTKPIGVLDETGIYSVQLIDRLENETLENGLPRFVVMNLTLRFNSAEKQKMYSDSLVYTGTIKGYLLIKNSDGNSPALEYRSKALGNFQDLNVIEESFNYVATIINLSSSGYDPGIINNLVSKIDVKTIKLSKEGDEEADFLTTFFSSYALLMMLLMLILFAGGMLVRSLVEEKSNRIMEVLLSSCSADDLLTGKVIGLGGLGLFQIIIWSVFGFVLVGTSIISIEIFNNIGIQLIYFLLGYILFTAIFVGVGSIVTTEHEAQQMTGYISILLLIPILIAIQIIQSPDSIIAKVLSYFPLTSPPLMILRLNVYNPPPAEIIITITILLLSIYIVIKISSKIFRIGILSYGKRPSFKELKSWITIKKL